MTIWILSLYIGNIHVSNLEANHLPNAPAFSTFMACVDAGIEISRQRPEVWFNCTRLPAE